MIGTRWVGCRCIACETLEEAMTTDRTTKILLAFIATGLWALLLRPAMTASPGHAAQAAPVQKPEFVAIAATDNPNFGQRVHVLTRDGRVYGFDATSHAQLSTSYSYGTHFGK
jgi:hypothetical protein